MSGEADPLTVLNRDEDTVREAINAPKYYKGDAERTPEALAAFSRIVESVRAADRLKEALRTAAEFLEHPQYADDDGLIVLRDAIRQQFLNTPTAHDLARAIAAAASPQAGEEPS